MSNQLKAAEKELVKGLSCLNHLKMLQNGASGHRCKWTFIE